MPRIKKKTTKKSPTPKVGKASTPTLAIRIEKYIEDKIAPMIRLDGGDIEFVSYDEKEKILQIRLAGACVACPLADVTLKLGVEQEIKKKFPQVKEVIALD